MSSKRKRAASLEGDVGCCVVASRSGAVCIKVCFLFGCCFLEISTVSVEFKGSSVSSKWIWSLTQERSVSEQVCFEVESKRHFRGSLD
jgi:hypothetical protein